MSRNGLGVGEQPGRVGKHSGEKEIGSVNERRWESLVFQGLPSTTVGIAACLALGSLAGVSE